jgi:site-specific DNA-methyltransferase (adenine-specific)
MPSFFMGGIMEIESITNKIINADCMDILKQLPDKCIDLVLTDAPYGIKESMGKNKNRGLLAKPTDYGYKDWDKKIPDKEYFEEILRVSKNQILFGGNYFVEYLHNSSCWLVWDKNNYGTDFADCELAWTNFKSAVRKYKWTWNGMLQEDMKNKEKRIHPTQKPLKLFEMILRDYSNENDLILDCFSGSGTTAVACHNLKRRFICIEKDYDYWKASVERLENAQAQLRLF